jgi:hypothetical protein
LLAATLAALIVPAALSQGAHRDGKARGGWAIDEMYHVVKITGSSGNSVSFDILGTAVKGKDNRVAVMTMDMPRRGTYYFANDTAVIPFANTTGKKHGRPMMGDYSNATINVSGASAVVAMKNVTTTGKGRGNMEIQFTSLGVYLPNDTAMTYPLSAPVRMTKSADNSSMLIIGNPSLRSVLQGMVTSGATFPADAQPVMLKTVDGVK